MSVVATTSHSSLDRTSMGTCRTSRQRLCHSQSVHPKVRRLAAAHISQCRLRCLTKRSAHRAARLSNSSLRTRQPARAVRSGAS